MTPLLPGDALHINVAALNPARSVFLPECALRARCSCCPQLSAGNASGSARGLPALGPSGPGSFNGVSPRPTLLRPRAARPFSAFSSRSPEVELKVGQPGTV